VPEPVHNFPFAYRLPTDVAAQIHGTAAVDTFPVEMGSPRCGSALATGLPSGPAQALRGENCRPGWVDENRLC
jgi:hypothetical protein